MRVQIELRKAMGPGADLCWTGRRTARADWLCRGKRWPHQLAELVIHARVEGTSNPMDAATFLLTNQLREFCRQVVRTGIRLTACA